MQTASQERDAIAETHGGVALKQPAPPTERKVGGPAFARRRASSPRTRTAMHYTGRRKFSNLGQWQTVGLGVSGLTQRETVDEKVGEVEAHRLAERLLANDKGFAVEIEPKTARLEPFGAVVVTVRCVGDTWGKYEDVLMCKTPAFAPRGVKIKADVRGAPLSVQVAGTAASPGVVRMPTVCQAAPTPETAAGDTDATTDGKSDTDADGNTNRYDARAYSSPCDTLFFFHPLGGDRMLIGCWAPCDVHRSPDGAEAEARPLAKVPTTESSRRVRFINKSPFDVKLRWECNFVNPMSKKLVDLVCSFQEPGKAVSTRLRLHEGSVCTEPFACAQAGTEVVVPGRTRRDHYGHVDVVFNPREIGEFTGFIRGIPEHIGQGHSPAELVSPEAAAAGVSVDRVRAEYESTALRVTLTGTCVAPVLIPTAEVECNFNVTAHDLHEKTGSGLHQSIVMSNPTEARYEFSFP